MADICTSSGRSPFFEDEDVNEQDLPVGSGRHWAGVKDVPELLEIQGDTYRKYKTTAKNFRRGDVFENFSHIYEENTASP